MSKLVGYTVALILFAFVADAREAVAVPRCEKPPVIDGSLGEACWQSAAALTGFVETRPGDNTTPSRETRVLLAQDSQALYIGIRAADEGSKVRATIAKRDDVLDDDHVALYLDTFDDRRRAYVLAFNPHGIQQDGIHAEGREVDYSADVVMESKGAVDANGYTIEVAIPFSSIRYRNGRWNLHVVRRIRHADEEISWMPLVRGNANFLAQAGTIAGLETTSGKRLLEVIPGVTIAESGARVEPTRFQTAPIDADPSVTMKMALASDMVFDATVNPDFAQIESDQPVTTANQRFPIFFAEKRPFFLEGIDVFQTPLNAMHSRTIVDPDYAAKASGKIGRTTFAALVASDNAPGVVAANGRNAMSGVVRVRRDIGADSFLGGIATSYDFVDRYNRLAGVDGRLTLDASIVVTFQLLGTSSEIGEGLGFFAEWKRSGRHLNITVTGEGRTPDYRAALGFTTQTDTNRWSVLTRWDSEPRPDKRLISWSFVHTALAQWDWDGNLKYAYLYPRVELNFRRQTKLGVYLYGDYLRVFEKELGLGPFAGKPDRSTVYKGVLVDLQSTPTKRVSFGLSVDNAWDFMDYDFGALPRFPRVSPAALDDPSAPLDPGPGRSLYVTARVELRPTDALRASLDHSRSRLVRNDTGRVAFDERLYSNQATYQFTSFAFARARIDYESLRSNVRGELLLGWTPSPGTSIYGGYAEDQTRNGFSPFTGAPEPGTHRNSWTVFVKMSYLVRRSF